ncbi:MAG: hypothetical protein MJE77_20870 [Proteobacteria bacterium]|nr:hypothetical protein [Pseudomonadota bacterium]
MEIEVADALARPALRGGELRDLSCGSTLCRLEVSWTDLDAREHATAAIPKQPPFDTHGFIHIRDDDHSDAVLYFARRGHIESWPSHRN